MTIVRGLGGEPHTWRADLIAQTAELLAGECQADHRVILVIDEAHLLEPDQLEALRMLANSGMDATSPFVGLLIGLPGLLRRLRMGMFSALDQRIATRYVIEPMDLGESSAYIAHHLVLVGRTEPLIADDAVARLHRYANGLPRFALWLRTSQLAAGVRPDRLAEDWRLPVVAERERDIESLIG